MSPRVRGVEGKSLEQGKAAHKADKAALFWLLEVGVIVADLDSVLGEQLCAQFTWEMLPAAS